MSSRIMLISGHRPDELRVAVVADKVLDDYRVAVAEAGLSRGNIYRGIVVGLQPGLNAAFLDIGQDRNAFLAGHDVVPHAAHRQPPAGHRHPRIDELLERGKPVLVQVTKDAGGSKGSAVTTNVSIAGRYLVLLPFEETRGISRKVEDEATRRELRELADRLDLPKGFGFIIRTNALGQNKTTLNRDLNALVRLWKRIRQEWVEGKGPRLLYSDQDLVIQALRDALDSTITEVLVDDEAVLARAREYMQAFMPRARTKLVLYGERMPLFSRFNLEPQIESIYGRRVPLQSGGSIVIDGTEALTAIDVNSGKTSAGGSHDETIYRTNMEAVVEVARQLRLRDIGGLVVVDLIDMRPSKHQRNVEKAMRDAMKADRARFAVGRISPNGLLEINRQRISQALQLRTHRDCPTCSGAGIIPSPEFVSLSLLRRIETRAAGGNLKKVRVSLHPELADAMQNSRRQDLASLESEFDIRIEIVAATSFHRSEEQVEWIERGPEDGLAPKESAAVRAADLAQATGAAPRSDGVEAASPGAEEDAPGDKKPRKRRRKRKKISAGTVADGLDERAAEDECLSGAVSEPVGIGDEQDDPDKDPGDEGVIGEEKRSRRKRRGGRRKKAVPGDSEPPSPPPDSGEAAGIGDVAAEGSAQAESEAVAPAASPRKRRRRGGKKKREVGSPGAMDGGIGDGAGNDGGSESQNSTLAGDADTAGAGTGDLAAKKRRRRRKKKPAGEGESG